MSIESVIYIVIVVLFVMGAITWRSISCLMSTSGASIRATDRERRDLHSLITQLVEKQNIPPAQQFDVAQVHAQERVAQVRADAALESQIAEQMKKIKTPASTGRPIVHTDPGSEMI